MAGTCFADTSECCLSKGDALTLDCGVSCLSSRIDSSVAPCTLVLRMSADAGLDMLQRTCTFYRQAPERLLRAAQLDPCQKRASLARGKRLCPTISAWWELTLAHVCLLRIPLNFSSCRIPPRLAPGLSLNKRVILNPECFESSCNSCFLPSLQSSNIQSKLERPRTLCVAALRHFQSAAKLCGKTTVVEAGTSIRR